MKRYLEFDIARTLALILMPMAHLLETSINIGLMEIETVASFDWILRIASMGPTIFMICLGINLALTRHNRAQDYFMRSWQILLLAIGLNVVRYLIPSLGAVLVTKDINYFFLAMFDSIISDILYFASLAFLYFGLCKKLKLTPFVILLIGVAFSIIDGFIPDLALGEDSILGAMLGNYFYVNRASAFAFTQWIVFPCIGYYFVSKYQTWKEQNMLDSVWLKIVIIFPILLAIDIAINLALGTEIIDIIGCQLYTYNVNLNGVVMLTLLIMTLMGIVYFISKKMHNERVNNFFIVFSKEITAYYCIQWTLVCWTAVILGALGYSFEKFVSPGLFAGLTIFEIVASYILMVLWHNKKIKKVNHE